MWDCTECTYRHRGTEEDFLQCAICGEDRPCAKRQRIEVEVAGADPRGSWAVSRDGRIHFDGSTPLDVFIREVRPSVPRDRACAWIQVSNPALSAVGDSSFNSDTYNNALSIITNEIQRQQQLGPSCASSPPRVTIRKEMKTQVVRQILKIAKDQGCTCGKWMLFLSPDKIDAAWEAVVRATVEGTLGCSAKVSSAPNERGTFLICNYVPDFSDQACVAKVVKNLKTLIPAAFEGRTGQRGSFKPDVFTHLGIYTNNKWRLDPTLSFDEEGEIVL